MFPYFRGHGFIGGLASQALVRIQFDGVQAREAARYDMGRPLREVEQGPDGALWLLEAGADAGLLKLTPVLPSGGATPPTPRPSYTGTCVGGGPQHHPPADPPP